MIFGDGVHAAGIGQIAGDIHPSPALVRGLEQIGFEIAVLVILVGRVSRAGVMLRSQEALRIGVLGGARGLLDLAPVLAAVLGYLHQAVVGANVDQAFLFGRFGDGLYVVIERGGDVLLNSVDGPDLPHQGQLVAVELAREIGAYGSPAIAAVVAAVQLLRAEVEPRVGMRADDERSVPVPAQGRVALGLLRLDGNALAGAPVEAHHGAVLHVGVDGVGVLGVDARVESIAAVGDEAIGVSERRVLRPGVAADAVVVLRAAIHLVERPILGNRDVIELSSGKVGLKHPGGGAVVAFIKAAIAAHQVVVVVLRVHPDVVVIHVFVAGAQRSLRATAVVRHHDVDAHDVDPVGIGGAHLHLGVILALLVVAVALLPSDSVISRAVEASAALRPFHLRIDDAGIRWRVVHADAAQLARGEAAANLGPRLADVDGAPQRALGPAVNDPEIAALALVRGGQQDVGIARVHDHIGHAGVIAHFDEAGRPGLAAIGGLVEAALAAAFPEWTGGGHVDHVGVAWVDGDAGDMFTLAQAHVAPGAAGVFT